jgi:hypothetical protein
MTRLELGGVRLGLSVGYIRVRQSLLKLSGG